MFAHETKIRVRYGETDQMGYLYYGHYAQYYEVGRAEMIRSLGFTYKELEEKQGVLMPVMSLNMRYVRPAYYDALLTVKTIVRKMPNATITFHHEITNEEGQMVNGGSVKLCFVDATTKKAILAPASLVNVLSGYFE